MLIECLRCHSEAEHEARGLCRNCYQLLQKYHRLGEYPDRKVAFAAMYQRYHEGEHDHAELKDRMD